MKNSTRKIAGYSAMALATAAVLPISCKKDKVVDDPEIDVITPNLTLTAPSLGTKNTSLMLQGNDVYFQVGNYYGDDIVYLDFDGYSSFQKDNDVSVNGGTWDFLPILNEGANIDTSSAAWLDSGSDNDDGYLFVKDNSPAPGASHGINGQGDKFVAFRAGSGNSFKYGWMKVNVSTDGKTFTLKEMAMSNVFNKVIKVGAK